MRENLLQTSSIFSKTDEKKNGQDTSTEKFQELQEELQEGEEDRCRTLRFEKSDANISLRDFYPDTLNCVIYNALSDKFFAGNLGKETIYEFPMTKYTVEHVTTKAVVLKAWVTEKEESEEEVPKFVLLTSSGYKVLDSFDTEEDGTLIVHEGKKYETKTSEEKEMVVSESNDTITYYYSKGSFTVKSGSTLYHIGPNESNKLLLADSSGTYIGYFLPVNRDDSINLHGRKYKMLQRITLALASVMDIESEEEYLLTCASQLLIEMNEFGATSYEHIEIINGVAILVGKDEEEEQNVLNVFTPNHQRIVLEPRYKINQTAFGNGLYFEKDNVLLLDNGSLIFTKRSNRKTVIVKDKEVKIPVEHLGDIL